MGSSTKCGRRWVADNDDFYPDSLLPNFCIAFCLTIFKYILTILNTSDFQSFILSCGRRQIHSSLSSFVLPSSPSENEDDSSTSCPEYELSYWRILTYLDSSPSDWRPSLYIGVGSPTPLPQF